jgi:hypothetical protein
MPDQSVGTEIRVGSAAAGEERARVKVMSKFRDHIKWQNLQDLTVQPEMLIDGKLDAAFGNKKFSMREMNRLLARHLDQNGISPLSEPCSAGGCGTTSTPRARLSAKP